MALHSACKVAAASRSILHAARFGSAVVDHSLVLLRVTCTYIIACGECTLMFAVAAGHGLLFV